jgi:hypothetical protein
MAKNEGSMVTTLKAGRAYTMEFPAGTNFASMRTIFKPLQVITLSPVTAFHEVKAGDIVLVKWKGGDYILHLVQEVQGDQFLIANSVGKINGWAPGSDILGKVTQVVEPPPRAIVPEMLDQLQAAYQTLIEREKPMADEIKRLTSVIDDLRWYAERIGAERWETPPRDNKWSFGWNLWHVTDQAVKAAVSVSPEPVRYFIDHGKEHVGQTAEIIALFASTQA